jgi:hypothetical protein
MAHSDKALRQAISPTQFPEDPVSLTMSSLVLELQAAAMDPSKRADALLRMALVVAAKLKLDDFKRWCEKELSGYGREDVPPYRRVRGELKAHNPYRGWIPVMTDDSELMEQLSNRDVGQSVSEIEHLLTDKDKGGILHIPLPHNVLLRVFGDTEAFRLGMVPTLLVSETEMHGILAAIRDTILQWSLKLEQDGIVGEGMTFSRDEIAKASHVTYNIQSFTGVLGDVSGSNVQVGDYATIHAQPKKAGVPQAARNEIEQIMDDLSSAAPEKKRSVARRGVEWVVKHGSAIGALSNALRTWFEPHLK